jgi:bacillithiol biosynthesis deacetylase BshB1
MDFTFAAMDETNGLYILAFGAHPDDVELAAGGTLLKHARAGKRTGIIDLTSGELGSRGSAELRASEALAAASFIGLTIRENLGLKDGFFLHDNDSIMKIITCIRKYQPQIVLCNSPADRHPDHGRASAMVREACFLSGLHKIETGELAPWRPRAVYMYIQDYDHKPDIVINISGMVDAKMQLLKCYSSQFYSEKMEGFSTPISGLDFLKFVEGRCYHHGRAAGFEAGEGFLSERTPGAELLRDTY